MTRGNAWGHGETRWTSVLKHPKGQSIRSLIVDDDKAIGDVLKELVSGEQISAHVLTDGLEGVQYVKKQPVDIVITDLMLPGLGGLEVLRQAKVTNPDVVVIIITGHASLESAMEAVREGAYDYIKKPFKLEEMGIAFNNAVERVHLVRENRGLLQALKDAHGQLGVISKERGKPNQKEESSHRKIGHLNFFSTHLPSLAFLGDGGTKHRNVVEELQRLSGLRKEGLLTEREFQQLKTHLIKAVEIYE
jgi:DNA-binding response OmpR family regulator